MMAERGRSLEDAATAISPVGAALGLPEPRAPPAAESSGEWHDSLGTPLSFVLATINEIDALPTLLAELNQLELPPFEVVVVDDGSTDGTREFVSRASAMNPRIRLVAHDGRRTLGPAQSEGVRETTGDYVIIMDSDLQHPTEVLPRLIAELDAGADLVIASRYCNGGSAGRRPAVRSIISRSAELIAKAVLPEARGIRDPLSGYFAFRRASLRPGELPTMGYKLLLQLLVMFRGARIVEVPYEFRHRTAGSSKITSNVRFVPLFVSETLVARRYRSRLAREPPHVVRERASSTDPIRT